MKIKDLTISRDQIGQARVPKSRAPFFRALLSCQNPLNCPMGPKNTVCHVPLLFSRFTNGSLGCWKSRVLLGAYNGNTSTSKNASEVWNVADLNAPFDLEHIFWFLLHTYIGLGNMRTGLLLVNLGFRILNFPDVRFSIFVLFANYF